MGLHYAVVSRVL